MYFRSWVGAAKCFSYDEKEQDPSVVGVKARDKNFDNALVEARKYVAHMRETGKYKVMRFGIVTARSSS